MNPSSSPRVVYDPGIPTFDRWTNYSQPVVIPLTTGRVVIYAITERHEHDNTESLLASRLIDQFWFNHQCDVMSQFYPGVVDSNTSSLTLEQLRSSAANGVWSNINPHPFNPYTYRACPVNTMEENTLNYRYGDRRTFMNGCSRGGRMRLRELLSFATLEDCFCQVHYRPLSDTPGSTVLHPSISAVWRDESIVCHAESHVREKDKEFLQLAVVVLSAIESHNGVTSIPTRLRSQWKSRVRKFRASNAVSYESFGNGYCYLKKILPKFRWPVARLLGPDPYNRDVEPFILLCENTKFKIASYGITGVSLHLDGDSCENDTSSYPFGWANHLRVGAKDVDNVVKLDKNQRRQRNSSILANCAANNANSGSVDKAARFAAHQRHIARYSRQKHDLLSDTAPIKMTRLNMVKDKKIKTGYRIIGTKITDNKISVIDNDGIVHGQLLFPMRKGFKMKSVAGDHGCGAAIYDIKKKDIGIIKKRMHTLPTGGRHWDSKILQHADLQGFKSLNWKESIDSSMIDELNPRSRIGSLGQGNHFCHIVRKETQYKLVVHVGSRGMFDDGLKFLKSTSDNRPTHEFYSLMQTCESFAHLNRDTIANYLVTGKLTDDGTLLSGEHFPHTRFDMIGSVPIIQKNITKNKKDSNRNLILGSPSGGIGFVASDERYLIHGSGPDPAVKGGFLDPDTITSDIWVSVFNFDRHTSGGGSVQLHGQFPDVNNDKINLEPVINSFPLVDTTTSLVALQRSKVGLKQNSKRQVIDAFSLPTIQSEYIFDE